MFKFDFRAGQGQTPTAGIRIQSLATDINKHFWQIFCNTPIRNTSTEASF